MYVLYNFAGLLLKLNAISIIATDTKKGLMH